MNWVLDVDIRSFFDAFHHEWLVKFIEHRIADRRVVRLIQKWLNAGVLEEGRRNTSGRRDAPGRQCLAVAGERLSPLRVRPVGPSVASETSLRRHDRREVCRRHRGGLPDKTDAERFLGGTHRTMRKFGLELHPEKTRLLEFGPCATENRKKRGEGKPETFNFLGFTHICGKKRSNGRSRSCGRRFANGCRRS